MKVPSLANLGANVPGHFKIVSLILMSYTLIIFGVICFGNRGVLFEDECKDRCVEVTSEVTFSLFRLLVFFIYLIGVIYAILQFEGKMFLSALLFFGLLFHFLFAFVLSKKRIKKSKMYYHSWVSMVPPVLLLLAVQWLGD